MKGQVNLLEWPSRILTGLLPLPGTVSGTAWARSLIVVEYLVEQIPRCKRSVCIEHEDSAEAAVPSADDIMVGQICPVVDKRRLKSGTTQDNGQHWQHPQQT